jgi:glycosyltransferase involved in cell wall biosynthesis
MSPQHRVRTSLLIIETHPVQYRIPIYARLDELLPGAVHVVFASDYSLRGGYDPGFSSRISWDTPLLDGYNYTILRSDILRAPRNWNDLHGDGLLDVIKKLRPSAILLNSLNFRYDFAAYIYGLILGIPVWMRCETQDRAFPRKKLKSAIRWLYYRTLYLGISKAFPIGVLNRRHWLRHGLHPSKMTNVNYCTPDNYVGLTQDVLLSRRDGLRKRLGLRSDSILVIFVGKLIPKKDPSLIFKAVEILPSSLHRKIALVFVGSGELQDDLMCHSQDACQDISVHFAGFVNQSELPDWYLAADILVLPSRQAGETWGLVANEALQAGCGVIVSEAVGCSADFGDWERFRTIPVGSAAALALAIHDLAAYPRSFSWATEQLIQYSIETAAQTLASAITELP